MSTRANILIKDKFGELWFYRHSDGYPDETLPTLKQFMRKVKKKEIRNNVSQASGWLIIIGQQEYYTRDWKVGSYEPTTGRHGDINFLYILDLEKLTIEIYKNLWEDGDKHVKTITRF